MNRCEVVVEDYAEAIKSFVENPEIQSIVRWDEDGLALSTEHEQTGREISTLRLLYRERSEVYCLLGRTDFAKADEEEMLRLNNKIK